MPKAYQGNRPCVKYIIPDLSPLQSALTKNPGGGPPSSLIFSEQNTPTCTPALQRPELKSKRLGLGKYQILWDLRLPRGFVICPPRLPGVRVVAERLPCNHTQRSINPQPC